jgi:uncharacterized membrane protein
MRALLRPGGEAGAEAFSGLLGLVVTGPVTVGVSSFFLRLHRCGEADMNLLFTKGFGENLGRHIGAYLLALLYTMLWSLLFVVPGIVKALSYSMTPFILADRPELTAAEAVRESARLMYGKKGKLFCLLLRFLGWGLLSAMTGGILYVFYVGPGERGSGGFLRGLLVGDGADTKLDSLNKNMSGAAPKLMFWRRVLAVSRLFCSSP